MAKKQTEKPEHLGQDEKKPHCGRRIAVTVAVCAAVAAAGAGGYAAWQQGQANASDEAASPQAQNAASGNASAEVVSSSAENGNAASSSAAAEGAGDGTSGSANANASSDDASGNVNSAGDANGNAGSDSTSDASSSGNANETDAQESQRQVGQHDAPTAEDQAAMASLRGQVSVSGAPAGFADSAGYQELLYQLAVWQRSGHALGFILTNLGSGATVSYNTDQVFYPASSIKGPFVCSLYEEIAEKGGDESTLDTLAAKTIEDSDNDAFRQLHQTFGESAFSTWLSQAGVPATAGHDYGYFTQYYYPHISCAQLNLMWSQIYRYCSSGTAPSKVLASYFAARTTSPIAQAVGSHEASWGKAGWYYNSGDYGAEPATVDAGIVFANKGPYQLVMMSDAPGELDQMAELAYGMDQAAADLAG